MNAQESCPRIEALSALTDDELRGDERLALQAHVAGCAICAPVLAELRGLRAGFAALPASPAVDVCAQVARRIGALAAAPGRAPRRAGPRWWQIALLAPGGAAAVALGLWIGSASLPAAVASAPAAQMAAFSALPPGSLCPASRACGGSLR